MTVLPPTNPDKVDQAVTTHLVRALDPQRGRALAAFRAHVPTPVENHDFRHAQAMRTLKWWTGAASAVAACLALVVTLQFVGNTRGHPLVVPPGAPRDPSLLAVNAPAMDQLELSRNVDGGTAVLDDQTPVHIIREQTLRQTQWFDPNEKATYSITQPVERVNYVPMQPY
jgi:hypothetical protein